MEKELKNAVAKSSAAENKLSSAVSAISLLRSEVKRLSPDGENSVLDMVDQLLRAATQTDFGLQLALIDRVSVATNSVDHPHD
jgi:hypothetical protein